MGLYIQSRVIPFNFLLLTLPGGLAANLLFLTLPGGVAAHLLLPRLRGAGEREARAEDTNTLQRQLQPAGEGSG